MNWPQIKQLITTTKSQEFLAMFPSAKNELDNLVAKPTCGVCNQMLAKRIKEEPNFAQKLQTLFNVQIDFSAIFEPIANPVAPTFDITHVFEDVGFDEWDSWFTNNFQKNNMQQIRNLTTFFNPITGKIKVSYIKIQGGNAMPVPPNMAPNGAFQNPNMAMQPNRQMPNAQPPIINVPKVTN
jgi:hypothetical protein